jgi:hypothetical protein
MIIVCDLSQSSNIKFAKNMASRWLPNTKEFFETLLRLIETSELNLNSTSYDSCEFLYRRLDASERTLSTLLLRIRETFGNGNMVPELYSSQNFVTSEGPGRPKLSAGVPADLDPPQNGPRPGPNPLANMDLWGVFIR